MSWEVQHYVRVEYHHPLNVKTNPFRKPHYFQMATDSDNVDALFAKWIYHVMEDYIPSGSEVIVKRDSFIIPNTRVHCVTFTVKTINRVLAKVIHNALLVDGNVDTTTMEHGDL